MRSVFDFAGIWISILFFAAGYKSNVESFYSDRSLTGLASSYLNVNQMDSKMGSKKLPTVGRQIKTPSVPNKIRSVYVLSADVHRGSKELCIGHNLDA